MKNIIFTLCFFLICGISQAQLKVVSDGDVVVGASSPGMANFKTKGTSELELALDAASGNADFTMQQAGATKCQIKYNVSVNALEFLVDDSNGGNFGLPLGAKAMHVDGNNKRVGIGTDAPSTLLHVNGSITYNGSLTNASDKRLKTDVKKFSYGLNEVMSLRPINYRYNGIGNLPVDENHVGIYAQDLQEVAPELVGTFDVVTYAEQTDEDIQNERATVLKNTEEYLNVKESAIKYMLINAIQEQQAIINDKEERIAELENKFALLESKLNNVISGIASETIESEVTLTYHDLAALEQNAPNPFNGQTRIEYTIPSQANSAQLDFYDLSGKLMKTVVLNHTGKGQLTINANDLPSGIYTYQLKVDDRLVESKKMSMQE